MALLFNWLPIDTSMHNLSVIRTFFMFYPGAEKSGLSKKPSQVFVSIFSALKSDSFNSNFLIEPIC